MATNGKEETKINWNYVIIGGAAIGGMALLLALVKTITGEDEAKREEAERILADWEREWNVVEPFLISIYAGDLIPTEQQTALLGDQLEQMKFKELAIKELSQSTWSELGTMAKDIGIGLGIAIGVPIAGWVAIKLTNNWIDKHRPPPNYPCPICDVPPFATKGQLKYHLETQHIVNTANLVQAQQVFLSTPIFVQNYIASQSGYYSTVSVDWRQVGVYVLYGIAIAAAIILIAGIVTAPAGASLATSMGLLFAAA